MPSIPTQCAGVGRRLFATAVSLLLVATLLTSCGGGPTPVRPPSIDASDAGDAALEQYDTNGDGKVAGDELEKAPGLKAALPRMDTNGDNSIDADEVAARVDRWQNAGIGLLSFGFSVTFNGSPLTGAVVTFEPEAFLGDEIKPASCTTSSSGTGGATIAAKDRPDPTWPSGIHLGLYKVKISKIVDGKETIPAKYNEATVLGQEVAQDVSEIANRRVIYALSTR